MPPGDDPSARYLWDAAEWDLILAETARAYVEESMRNGAVVFGQQMSIDVSFDVTNPKVQEWLARYTGLMANRVNETVREGIREAIQVGLREGESSRQIRDRVLEAFGAVRDEAGKIQAADGLKYRAEMIARTETARAETSGYREQAKEAGVTEIVWMTAPDPCDWCAELDGRVVAIDKPFFAKGDTFTILGENDNERDLHLNYADVDGPPLHPWCRCSLVTTS